MLRLNVWSIQQLQIAKALIPTSDQVVLHAWQWQTRLVIAMCGIEMEKPWLF